jgi:hypothetical protein
MLTPHNNVTPRKKQDGGERGTGWTRAVPHLGVGWILSEVLSVGLSVACLRACHPWGAWRGRANAERNADAVSKSVQDGPAKGGCGVEGAHA